MFKSLFLAMLLGAGAVIQAAGPPTNAPATVLAYSSGALAYPSNLFTRAGLVTTNDLRTLSNSLVSMIGTNGGGTNGVPGVAATGGIVASTNESGVVTLSLYSAPTIAAFANDQVSVEQGATVAQTALSWTLAGGIISTQSVNQSIGGLALTNRVYIHTNSYTTNRTYTLTISDGVTTNTASTTVTFYQKVYWGASASASLDDAGILGLSGAFATGRAQTRSVVTSSSYIYLAWPASFGEGTFVVDGFADEGWTLVSRAVVNASGYSSTYHIYRHTLPTTGTYSITVN
jgi:hypothetical protein